MIGKAKDVKHGCVSCVHYRVKMQQEPCRSCKDWSGWKDADRVMQDKHIDRELYAEILAERGIAF